MGDAIGLLPITSTESKGNEKGRVYRAHGTLRPFMTELEVSISSSLPSVSKPIAIVEGLRDQSLRSDAAKLQTSANFHLAFSLLLPLLPFVSSLFSS